MFFMCFLLYLKYTDRLRPPATPLREPHPDTRSAGAAKLCHQGHRMGIGYGCLLIALRLAEAYCQTAKWVRPAPVAADNIKFKQLTHQQVARIRSDCVPRHLCKTSLVTFFMTTFDRRNGQETCRCPDIGRSHMSPGSARNVGRKQTF